MTEQVNEIMSTIKSFMEDLDDYEFKRAVASHSTPVEQAAWNGASARTALARWASSDGSGDKDKISWPKFARGFTWFDSEKAENLTSYKLPHHTIIEDKLVAIWSGVVAAMGALLGARGGTDIPDAERKAVYNHLARHYRDFDREPPEFKEYDEAQLENIEKGNEPDHVEGEPPDVPECEVPTTEEPTTDLDNIKQELFERLEEFEASVTVRVTVLQEMFKDFMESMATRFPETEPVEAEVTEEDSPVIDSELKAMLDTMETGPAPEGGGE